MLIGIAIVDEMCLSLVHKDWTSIWSPVRIFERCFGMIFLQLTKLAIHASFNYFNISLPDLFAYSEMMDLPFEKLAQLLRRAYLYLCLI